MGFGGQGELSVVLENVSIALADLLAVDVRSIGREILDVDVLLRWVANDLQMNGRIGEKVLRRLKFIRVEKDRTGFPASERILVVGQVDRREELIDRQQPTPDGGWTRSIAVFLRVVPDDYIILLRRLGRFRLSL